MKARCAQDDGRGIRFHGSPVAASPELFVCTQYPARVPVACGRRCIHSKCPRGERLRISLRFCSSCEIISSSQLLTMLTLSECSWVLRHMLGSQCGRRGFSLVCTQEVRVHSSCYNLCLILRRRTAPRKRSATASKRFSRIPAAASLHTAPRTSSTRRTRISSTALRSTKARMAHTTSGRAGSSLVPAFSTRNARLRTAESERTRAVSSHSLSYPSSPSLH